MENEITNFFLRDLGYLYVKARTFWLVNSKMDARKLIFSEKQNQLMYNIIKKICNTPEISWNLLIGIQKQLLLAA